MILQIALDNQKIIYKFLKKTISPTNKGIIKLLLHEKTTGALSKLEFESISEIKIKKDNTIEIKFVDKLKALQMLIDLEKDSLDINGDFTLNKAIQRSTDKLREQIDDN